MIGRGLASVVGVALCVAGCGGTPARPRSAAIHLDGKRAPGDYVVEADASGARFLVPAPLVAVQGTRTFDVAAPTRVVVGEPPSVVTTGPPPYRSIVASATAVVPHAAHVELLATGQAGRRVALSWAETCGWTHEGTADVGGIGGHGIAVLRSPAVALVKMPPASGGVPSCYVAATAAATTFTRRVTLAIIDY